MAPAGIKAEIPDPVLRLVFDLSIIDYDGEDLFGNPFMLQTFFAQQEQYTLAYVLIFAVVLLGYVVVCIPRPRKKAYPTADAERDAQLSLIHI